MYASPVADAPENPAKPRALEKLRFSKGPMSYLPPHTDVSHSHTL